MVEGAREVRVPADDPPHLEPEPEPMRMSREADGGEEIVPRSSTKRSSPMEEVEYPRLCCLSFVNTIDGGCSRLRLREQKTTAKRRMSALNPPAAPPTITPK